MRVAASMNLWQKLQCRNAPARRTFLTPQPEFCFCPSIWDRLLYSTNGLNRLHFPSPGCCMTNGVAFVEFPLKSAVAFSGHPSSNDCSAFGIRVGAWLTL